MSDDEMNFQVTWRVDYLHVMRGESGTDYYYTKKDVDRAVLGYRKQGYKVWVNEV